MVCSGDRVFLCDRREYGTVVKKGILGFKVSNSYVVTSDSGKNICYTGSISKHVVCCKDNMNDCGSRFLLPLDLKTISQDIIKNSGISPKKKISIFQKFSKLDDEEHQKYRDEYSLVSSDAAKTKKFIMDIYTELS